ncbi:MAG: ribonuclease E inhibitor RraB [Balneola sp.]
MKRPKGIDKSVIQKITKLGGDLDRKRHVDFFMYFPTEIDAVNAEVELINLQFETFVNKSPFDNKWCCNASKKMIVSSERLEDIRNWLEKLTEKNNGNYDGWGTEV